MACKECDSGQRSKTVGVGKLPFAAALNSSPVLAYAWALGLPFVPFILNLRAVFSDPSSLTTQQLSFEGSDARLNVSSLIDKIGYTIDAPNYNAGLSSKAVDDWYFQMQGGGLQATLQVNGAPRYTVAPFFTPLPQLFSTLEDWPFGWVLEYTQSVIMQFTATQSLPSFPTTVTVSYRMWQPGSGQALDLVGMTNDVALQKLSDLIRTGNVKRNVAIPQVAGGPAINSG